MQYLLFGEHLPVLNRLRMFAGAVMIPIDLKTVPRIPNNESTTSTAGASPNPELLHSRPYSAILFSWAKLQFGLDLDSKFI